MKISKSKQELARIISENGGWREGEFAAQDGDGGVGGYGEKPVWSLLYKYWRNEAFGEWFVANKIKNHHQTVLSRAEYFHLYPAQEAAGWIEWKGGECPVEKGTLVDVIWRDGRERIGVKALQPGGAGHDFWVSDGMVNDIIAYRLHKPEQAKPEFCKSVMRTIPEPEAKPTIEQLAADYRNAKGYAKRKQQEAYVAKADADAILKALEIAGEALGLLVSPITEKQKPELAIAVQVGDEVECIKSNVNPGKYMGRIGTVSSVDVDDTSTPYLVDFGGEAKIWCHEVKFIRRPQQQGDSMKFKTVAEYYSYMAQGNCCAPKFEDLHDSAKAYWVADFEKYNNKAGVDSE